MAHTKESLQDTPTRAELHIERLENLLKKADSANDKLAAKVKELTARSSELEEEVQELEKAIANLETENERLKAKIKRSPTEQARLAEKLYTEMSKLQESSLESWELEKLKTVAPNCYQVIMEEYKDGDQANGIEVDGLQLFEDGEKVFSIKQTK